MKIFTFLICLFGKVDDLILDLLGVWIGSSDIEVLNGLGGCKTSEDRDEDADNDEFEVVNEPCCCCCWFFVNKS